MVVLDLDWSVYVILTLSLVGLIFLPNWQAGAESHLTQGMTALEQERVQAAAFHLKLAVAEDPGNRLAWFHLAESLVDLGELLEAEKAYRKALGNEKVGQDARVGLATLLADLGRTAESQELLERALQVQPEFAPAHLQMGLLLEQLSKPGEAMESYAKAVEHGSEDPRAFYRLAILHSKRDNSREALNHLRQAFDRAPERYVARVVNSLLKVRNDFEQIRYLPEFQELLNEYREYWPEGSGEL